MAMSVNNTDKVGRIDDLGRRNDALIFSLQHGGLNNQAVVMSPSPVASRQFADLNSNQKGLDGLLDAII